MLASGKDVVEIEATLSSELKSVKDWLIDYKLSLHLGETQSIVFGTRNTLCKCNTLNIVCNGIAIESKSTVTYLGVTLDQSLSGDVIASDVLFKTSNKLKFLYRNARKFNMKTKNILVSSLIQCNFDYTCSAWYSGLSKKLKCRMQCSQNKIVRIMLNAPPRFHVGANKCKTVGLLPVECRVEQLKLDHMFNIINLKAPEYLRKNVEMVHHRYPTRVSNLSCVIPRVKGSGQTSFFILTYATGTNKLPTEIKQCQVKKSFRKKGNNPTVQQIDGGRIIILKWHFKYFFVNFILLRTIML